MAQFRGVAACLGLLALTSCTLPPAIIAAALTVTAYELRLDDDVFNAWERARAPAMPADLPPVMVLVP